MKIVKQSVNVIEKELSAMTIEQRLERCARLCYKSEGRFSNDPEASSQFCKKLYQQGHYSIFEMAVVHLEVEGWDNYDWEVPKFSTLTYTGSGKYVITASIRSFIENFGDNIFSKFLKITALTPLLEDYINIDEEDRNWVIRSNVKNDISVRIIPQRMAPFPNKHFAIKFTTNRAISHQLVRHRPMSWLQESQRYCIYKDELEVIQPSWREHGLFFKADPLWKDHMLACEGYYKEQLKNGLSPQYARGGLPNDTKTELIGYASPPQWEHLIKLRSSAGADPMMKALMEGLWEKLLSEVYE